MYYKKTIKFLVSEKMQSKQGEFFLLFYNFERKHFYYSFDDSRFFDIFSPVKYPYIRVIKKKHTIKKRNFLISLHLTNLSNYTYAPKFALVGPDILMLSHPIFNYFSYLVVTFFVSTPAKVQNKINFL